MLRIPSEGDVMTVPATPSGLEEEGGDDDEDCGAPATVLARDSVGYRDSVASSISSSFACMQNAQQKIQDLYCEVQKRYVKAMKPLGPWRPNDMDFIPMQWAEAQRADVRLGIVAQRRKKKMAQAADWLSKRLSEHDLRVCI